MAPAYIVLALALISVRLVSGSFDYYGYQPAPVYRPVDDYEYGNDERDPSPPSEYDYDNQPNPVQFEPATKPFQRYPPIKQNQDVQIDFIHDSELPPPIIEPDSDDYLEPRRFVGKSRRVVIIGRIISCHTEILHYVMGLKRKISPKCCKSRTWIRCPKPKEVDDKKPASVKPSKPTQIEISITRKPIKDPEDDSFMPVDDDSDQNSPNFPALPPREKLPPTSKSPTTTTEAPKPKASPTKSVSPPPKTSSTAAAPPTPTALPAASTPKGSPATAAPTRPKTPPTIPMATMEPRNIISTTTEPDATQSPSASSTTSAKPKPSVQKDFIQPNTKQIDRNGPQLPIRQRAKPKTKEEKVSPTGASVYSAPKEHPSKRPGSVRSPKPTKSEQAQADSSESTKAESEEPESVSKDQSSETEGDKPEDKNEVSSDVKE